MLPSRVVEGEGNRFHRYAEGKITSTNNKCHPFGWHLLLVEVRGIEPLSESNLEGTSPGAVCYLHSLTVPGTNTLHSLVASLCVVRAKLSARTVSTSITPEPGSWTFRGGWAPN